MNTFVKLLMLEIGEAEYLLLYGFAIPTEQTPFPWRKRKQDKKKGKCILTAILSEKEVEDFADALTRPRTFFLGETEFTSPVLKKRGPVLANDNQEKKDFPQSAYSKVTEYWNVDKEKLYDRICQTVKLDGKALYLWMNALFSWMNVECGVDFSMAGHRWGNVEVYHPSTYTDGFVIETHKEIGLTKTTIRKTRPFAQGFMVNCTAECRNRSLINQCKWLHPEEETLDFLAEEPMSHITVKIWEDDTGELVYAEDIHLMMRLAFDMHLGSTPYRIQDSWTEKLHQSAPNRSEKINEEIECVAPTSTMKQVIRRSDTHNEIDCAAEDGRALCVNFRFTRTRGAFIANQNKDGEIDSFLKILEYIKDASIRKVIIADPYFSVRAAEKLLSRIPRTEMEVEIISSLGKTNPDTGNPAKAADEARRFLEKNSAILHQNLRVYHLYRGDKPVFHDRYLIRYKKNGEIDGFLLSNSLNSMGQAYPFVIAPLEKEVCLEICDYLDDLRDPEVQAQLPKKERIACETLFDSRAFHAKRVQEHELQCAPEKEPSWSGWVTEWYNGNRNKLSIPAGNLSEEAQCFLDEFPNLARKKEKEQSRRLQDVPISNSTRQLKMLLDGKGEMSRQGVSQWLTSPEYICYSGVYWLRPAYTLLLWMSPSTFLSLLNETKSPLMFDVLMARMREYPWSAQLYAVMMESELLCMQILCAEWLYSQLEAKQNKTEDIEAILRALPPEKCVLQAVRLISAVTFRHRTLKPERVWAAENPEQATVRAEKEAAQKKQSLWNLRNRLLAIASETIVICGEAAQKTAIFWLYDCENVSQCRLYLDFACAVEQQAMKSKLLDEAIAIAKQALLRCDYEWDVSEMVSCYLEAMEVRYGDHVEEKILQEMIANTVFEAATEPGLKDYAYDRWRAAYIRAKRQMYLLDTFHEKHPEATKVQRCIETWHDRLSFVTNACEKEK